MRRRAEELARAGNHDGWLSIMAQMTSEFYRDPHFIFEPPHAKQRFDDLCSDSQSKGSTDA